MIVFKEPSIVAVGNAKEGLEVAKKLLYKSADKETVLFLSGGETPKDLYKDLAKEKKLNVGSVATVDERFDPPFHQNSNERMIKETGLIEYLSSINVPFYGILQELHRHSGNQAKPEHPESPTLSRDSGVLPAIRRVVPRMTVIENVAEEYDKTVGNLFAMFKKRVAIMGLGEDGHTAGLPARVQNSKFKIQSYVTEIKDFPGKFKERVTLTFKALEKINLLIVLVFGSAKQTALKLMFTKGSVKEIPARFYTKEDIAIKTIVITDQKV